MAQRNEVFQSKVLQKLYPAVSKPEKGPSPPSIVDALTKKTCIKRKTCQEGTDGAKPGRRVYTVLPPPADYMRHTEISPTNPHLANSHSAKDPSEESNNRNQTELNQGEAEVQEVKRRRRKRKSSVNQKPAQNDAISEFSLDRCHPNADEGGERISKNRRRKMKKKRHKEKLLCMGLMPRASALEFTYHKDANVEERKEDNGSTAEEVCAFLRTTLEIYVADSSVQADKRPLISETVENLLHRISSGCRPTTLLQQLCVLKGCVQQNEAEKLEKALKELHHNSFMSEDETAAVNSLFQYWITDILPIQGDKTRLPITHP